GPVPAAVEETRGLSAVGARTRELPGPLLRRVHVLGVHVLRCEEVEDAVAVVVEERAAGVEAGRDAGPLRRLLERSVAAVPVESRPSVRRDEEVRAAVAVD